ncbi:hypothetical protein ACFL04_00815 [Patescibacteria group bacterium]
MKFAGVIIVILVVVVIISGIYYFGVEQTTNVTENNNTAINTTTDVIAVNTNTNNSNTAVSNTAVSNVNTTLTNINTGVVNINGNIMEPRRVTDELCTRVMTGGSLLQCDKNGSLYYALIPGDDIEDASIEIMASDGAPIVSCGGQRSFTEDEVQLCDAYPIVNCTDLTSQC